ncbi:MAG TPA: carboxypeptidase regulatory-like domain-containing protein [Pyrinomonadaceae bacterium]|jgi:tetratricopeptide (TPR) repeat protein
MYEDMLVSFRIDIQSLFILLLFVTTASSASAQGHTIRGKVRDSAGVNMPRVTVSLESGNGAMINQTVTNNEGDFAFTGLSDNSYALTVSAPDYNPATERVDFVRSINSNDPGETRTVEITLIGKAGAPFSRGGVRFVQNVPKEAGNSYVLGMTSLKEGRQKEGVEFLQKAISVFADYFDAHFALANEFILEEKFNAAIGHLDEARRINPKDDRIFQAFGVIMMQQQKFAVAARIFAEAASLNPRELNYLVRQGTALIEQASRIDPKKSAAAADERNFAFTEAEKVLNRAYDLSGKKLAIVHLQLARLYEKKGDPARAASELEQYLHQSPDDKKADQILGAIKKLRTAKTQD